MCLLNSTRDLNASLAVDRLKNGLRFVYYTQLTVGLFLIVLVTVWLLRQTRQNGGLKRLSAFNMHVFNLCAALFSSALTAYVELLGRDLSVFQLSISRTGSSAEESIKSLSMIYVFIDFFNTFTFVYSTASVAYLCVQRCRMVHRPSVEFDRTRAAYQLIYLWAVSFVAAVVFEWFLTSLIPFYKCSGGWVFMLLQMIVQYVFLTAITFGYYLSMRRRLKNTVFDSNALEMSSQTRALLERRDVAERTMVLAKIYAAALLPYFLIWTVIMGIDPMVYSTDTTLSWLIFLADACNFSTFSLLPLGLLYLNDAFYSRFMKFTASRLCC